MNNSSLYHFFKLKEGLVKFCSAVFRRNQKYQKVTHTDRRTTGDQKKLTSPGSGELKQLCSLIYLNVHMCNCILKLCFVGYGPLDKKFNENNLET